MSEIRENILKSSLKKKAILTQALVNSTIFFDGTWWRIVHLRGDSYILRELTNAEMTEVLNSRKLVIVPELEKKEKLSEGN